MRSLDILAYLKTYSVLIGDFVALDAPARREGQIASKKATKKVASDVTSTSTKIEGSGDIGGMSDVGEGRPGMKAC